MLPAIPLAMKIGGPIALTLLLAGGWYLYKESIRDEGREECKQEQTDAINAQAKAVQDLERNQYETTIAILKRQMAEKEDFDAKTRQVLAAREADNKRLQSALAAKPEVIHEVEYVDREVEKLAPYEVPCFVPWGDVDLVDDLTRLHNEIPYSRVPDRLEAGQRSDLSGPSNVTCAQFTKRIAELTSRLGHTLINWRTMSEHAWAEYAKHEAFRKGSMIDETE